MRVMEILDDGQLRDHVSVEMFDEGIIWCRDVLKVKPGDELVYIEQAVIVKQRNGKCFLILEDTSVPQCVNDAIDSVNEMNAERNSICVEHA